jgi:hypothetical protein
MYAVITISAPVTLAPALTLALAHTRTRTRTRMHTHVHAHAHALSHLLHRGARCDGLGYAEFAVRARVGDRDRRHLSQVRPSAVVALTHTHALDSHSHLLLHRHLLLGHLEFALALLGQSRNLFQVRVRFRGAYLTANVM